MFQYVGNRGRLIVRRLHGGADEEVGRSRSVRRSSQPQSLAKLGAVGVRLGAAHRAVQRRDRDFHAVIRGM